MFCEYILYIYVRWTDRCQRKRTDCRGTGANKYKWLKEQEKTVFVVSLWNHRRWHTLGPAREVVSVGIWYYHRDTDRETASQWESVRVRQLGGEGCVWVFLWRVALLDLDVPTVQQSCTPQMHTWQNILSLSVQGLLYRGLPVALRECEKHLSVCCGLAPSSHPIMDLGCGPSAVLSKHYFWW